MAEVLMNKYQGLLLATALLNMSVFALGFYLGAHFGGKK